MTPYYLIQTSANMFRAAEGQRYPWTADEAEARHYAGPDEAARDAYDHAGFMARPLTDYTIIEVREFWDETAYSGLCLTECLA